MSDKIISDAHHERRAILKAFSNSEIETTQQAAQTQTVAITMLTDGARGMTREHFEIDLLRMVARYLHRQPLASVAA